MYLWFFALLIHLVLSANHVAVSINNLPEDIAYNETYFRIIEYTFKKHNVDVVLHAYHPDPDNLTTVHDTHGQMVLDGINYAIIGDTISSTTSELIVQQDIHVFKTNAKELPIISNSATSDTLSNSIDFPNFLRTIPVDSFSFSSIVAFVDAFNKKNVAMIYTNDPSGNSGYFRVNKLCNEKNISLLGVVYSNTMESLMQQVYDIPVIISNMYMEELFDTWKRFPKALDAKHMWVLTDAAMVISETEFTDAGFKDVINKNTNVVVANLLSVDNNIIKELKSNFGDPLPPLGSGYYDAVTAIVKGWSASGSTYNFSKFTGVKFEGATGKVSFDSNGDRVGVMGIYRIFIGRDYPLLSQFENGKLTFESGWADYLFGYTDADIRRDSSLSVYSLSTFVIPLILFLF
ncbi:hypothetical protein EIN_328390 [Entamoeba invadens IP1]|uniref:Receptor ligand binding region domain-containing protein n=1 Tax=Entamoeba invadens IP1 TaxID=370355 RepID=A0A0A1TXQ5_ENTIV|nr:hypothetical protein EIN_328390 [Entamoeba invadens IP1]ELP86162.1 hypothetical protein EIN_328390 [Entamoeba invadens IP1]|eukprot:XP_004185508.1 hypothetical protein EIN_328390 [Entamoeba invadens IP1]